MSGNTALAFANDMDKEIVKVSPHKVVKRLDWKKFMQNEVANNEVDLILTDPPYAISKKTGFQQLGKNSVERFAVSMDFGKWDHKKINLKLFTEECYRVLRRGGTAIIWYDIWKISELKQEMEQAGFKMIRDIIWQKTNPVPLNSKAIYLSNSREQAVVGVKVGKPTFHSQYDSGIYRLPIPRHGGKREHPTQKPIDLFDELVVKHSNPGDFVIDPFLGSGTTGVSAMKHGRKFRGCDIDMKYVKIARRRVAEYND